MKRRHEKSSFMRRQVLVRSLVYGTLGLLILAAAAYGQDTHGTVALRDIGFIAGRPVSLTGIGLIVGLNGTGDGSLLSHSDRTLEATLGHLGIDTKGHAINTMKVAAVLVQSELSPGCVTGQRVDVRVTALGDATNLAGGTLVPVALTSRDGRFRETASGPVATIGNRPLSTAPAAAKIDHAITVSTPIFMSDVPDRCFTIEARGLNAEQVSAVVGLINARFGEIAGAHSRAGIQIELPVSYEDFNERAGLVLQLAALPVHEAVPGLLADRSSLKSADNMLSSRSGWFQEQARHVSGLAVP